MKPNVPARIPIAHDDHHASRIGHLEDGRQFLQGQLDAPGGDQ